MEGKKESKKMEDVYGLTEQDIIDTLLAEDPEREELVRAHTGDRPLRTTGH